MMKITNCFLLQMKSLDKKSGSSSEITGWFHLTENTQRKQFFF